jgi:hypothetical protein
MLGVEGLIPAEIEIITDVSKAKINSWRYNHKNRYGGLMSDAFKEYMTLQGLENATVFEKMLHLERFKKIWYSGS